MANKALKLAFILSATDKMSRVIDDAVNKSASKLTAFERRTTAVGKSMMKTGAIMTGAGAAIGTATLGIAKTTAEYGDEAVKASQKTGVSIENYQKLAYAARYSNVEQTELQRSLVELSKKMSSAAEGNKAAMQTFKDLGIRIKNTDGSLRSSNEVLEDLAAVFAKVKDGSAKTALAMTLFGRGGSQMIPFLNTGKDGIKAMGDEAERMGFILSTEVTKAGEQFNDNLNRVKDSLKGVMFQLGTAFIPLLNNLVQRFTTVITKVTAWLQENPKLADTIGKIAIVLTALLVVLGTATIGVGTITFMVGKLTAAWRTMMLVVSVSKALFAAAANGMLFFRIQYAALVIWQKLATIAQWLFNAALWACPVVWIIAAIIAIGAAVYLLIKYWDKVKAFFGKLWQGVKNIFSNTWEWIKKMFLI